MRTANIGIWLLLVLLAPIFASAFTAEVSYVGVNEKNATSGSLYQGNISVKTNVYDAQTGGSLLATDTRTVEMISGNFLVKFNLSVADPSAVLWIETNISGAVRSRFQLTASPQSLLANNTAYFGGQLPSYYLNTSGGYNTTSQLDARYINKTATVCYANGTNCPAGSTVSAAGTANYVAYFVNGTHLAPTMVYREDGGYWGFSGNRYPTAAIHIPTNRGIYTGELRSPWFGTGGYRNLLFQTEDMTSINWTKNNVNVSSANAMTDPRGSATAEILNGTDPASNVTQTIGNATLGNWTYSVFIKGNQTNTVTIYLGSENQTWGSKAINVTTSWERYDVTLDFTNPHVNKTVMIAMGVANISVWGNQLEPYDAANQYSGPRTTTQLTAETTTTNVWSALTTSGTITSSGAIVATTTVTATTDVLVQGSDVYDDSGDLHPRGEDNMYFGIDYNANDAQTTTFEWNRNTNVGTGAATGDNRLMRLHENGSLTIGSNTNGDAMVGTAKFAINATNHNNSATGAPVDVYHFFNWSGTMLSTLSGTGLLTVISANITGQLSAASVNFTTDIITQGRNNLYDNRSWNQTAAANLFLQNNSNAIFLVLNTSSLRVTGTATLDNAPECLVDNTFQVKDNWVNVTCKAINQTALLLQNFGGKLIASQLNVTGSGTAGQVLALNTTDNTFYWTNQSGGSGGIGAGGWLNSTSGNVTLANPSANVTIGAEPTLFIDTTNGYVGIGTSGPGERLDIDGNVQIGGKFKAFGSGGTAFEAASGFSYFQGADFNGNVNVSAGNLYEQGSRVCTSVNGICGAPSTYSTTGYTGVYNWRDWTFDSTDENWTSNQGIKRNPAGYLELNGSDYSETIQSPNANLSYLNNTGYIVEVSTQSDNSSDIKVRPNAICGSDTDPYWYMDYNSATNSNNVKIYNGSDYFQICSGCVPLSANVTWQIGYNGNTSTTNITMLYTNNRTTIIQSSNIYINGTNADNPAAQCVRINQGTTNQTDKIYNVQILATNGTRTSSTVGTDSGFLTGNVYVRTYSNNTKKTALNTFPGLLILNSDTGGLEIYNGTGFGAVGSGGGSGDATSDTIADDGVIQANELQDAAVNSSKLNSTNSPSGGQYLTYGSNGQFTWATGSAAGGGNVTSTGNSSANGYIAYFDGNNLTIKQTGLISNETNVTKYTSGINSAIWGGGAGLVYLSNTAYVVSKDSSLKFCISTTHGTIGCNSERGKIDSNGFWYFGASGGSATARVTVDGNLSVSTNSILAGNLTMTAQNGALRVQNLSGTGNDYACVDSNGQFYRSDTACA